MASKTDEEEFTFDEDEGEEEEEEVVDDLDAPPKLVPGKRGPQKTARPGPQVGAVGRPKGSTARVAQPKYAAFRNIASEGIVNTDTNEAVAETQWEVLAEILNRLEELRDLVGRA